MTAYSFDKVTNIAKYTNSNVVGVMAQFELTAALADNDTIGDLPIPKNAVLLSARLVTSELDTNGSPTLTANVGIADGASLTLDEDSLIDGATTGAAVNIQEINVSTISSNLVATGAGYKVTHDGAYIRITVDGAPATGATSGHVLLFVEYTNDAV